MSVAWAIRTSAPRAPRAVPERADPADDEQPDEERQHRARRGAADPDRLHLLAGPQPRHPGVARGPPHATASVRDPDRLLLLSGQPGAVHDADRLAAARIPAVVLDDDDGFDAGDGR